MSVINKMLQEIEERHDENAQKNIPGVVRAVPGEKQQPAWVRVVLSVVLLLGVAAVGFGYWSVVSSKKPQPKAVSVVAPRVVSPVAEAVPAQTNPVAEAIEPQLQTSPVMASTPAPAGAGSPRMTQAVAPLLDKPLVRAREDGPLKSADTPVIVNPKPATQSKAEPEKLANIKHVSEAQRADNRYREALSLVSQGRGAEAQTALEEVLQLDPRHLGARQVLLALHVEAKRYDAAEQLARDALQRNLAPAAYAMTLARLQVEQADLAGALATLEKYAAQAGGDADYTGFYAALLQRAKRHAEAVTRFQQALSQRPNQASWWLGLGLSLQAEKRYTEAEQAYQRAKASPALSAELQALVEQRLQQVREPR